MNQTVTKKQMACLELSLLKGLRAGQAAEWSQRFGSAENMLRQPAVAREMKEQFGLKEAVWQEFLQLEDSWRKNRISDRAGQVLEACRQNNIRWMSFEEDGFPDLLKQIANPPMVLYYRGDLDILHQVCVSIVGSRKASHYGQKAAYEVAAAAADAGYTVVSGLAIGIDASAHKGALDAMGKTAAVMPCGLDLCYPKSHLWLFNRICQQGVVLSEYPPGQKTEKWHFIERNRLISGLSVATVVAQAGPKSGSIRTAQLAAEQGREVFGVPGDIFDLEYLGVHNLIQDGANVLTSPKGMVKALSGQISLRMLSEKKLGHSVNYMPKRKSCELSNEAAVRCELQRKNEQNQKKAGEALWLYDQIGEFGCLPEELCQLTGRGAAEVQQAITILELRGLIQQDFRQKISKV